MGPRLSSGAEAATSWAHQALDVPKIQTVMTAEHATGVIIITSGLFTQEAKRFAENEPIDLVEGHQLAESIRGVQAQPFSSETETKTPQAIETICQNAALNSSCV